MKVRIYIRDQNDHARGKWLDMEDYQNVSQLLGDIVDMMKAGTSPLGSWEPVDYEGITSSLAEWMNINEWVAYGLNVRKFAKAYSPTYAAAYIAWANLPANHSRAMDVAAFDNEYADTGTWRHFVGNVVWDEALELIPEHLRDYFDHQKFESHLKERYYIIDKFIFKRV